MRVWDSMAFTLELLHTSTGLVIPSEKSLRNLFRSEKPSIQTTKLSQNSKTIPQQQKLHQNLPSQPFHLEPAQFTLDAVRPSFLSPPYPFFSGDPTKKGFKIAKNVLVSCHSSQCDFKCPDGMRPSFAKAVCNLKKRKFAPKKVKVLHHPFFPDSNLSLENDPLHRK